MRKIGQIEYDPKSRLGSGAFAHVFSGTFQERRVAVKRVTIENVSDREENALNSLLNHPNVIKLYHTEQSEDFKFYALEICAASMEDIFLPDDNPKKYKGPLPLHDLDVLRQLSEGLQYIHENGFVHRDIKPGNVLVSYPKDDDDRTVELKWADFGLSKSVSSGGSFSISGMRGTINWIAPEILATLGGDKSREIRGTVESDTWSFGCVVFAYLTNGKHPFGDNDITRNILDSNAINLTELPSDHFAANIIREMIQTEPKNRIKLSQVVEILQKQKELTSQQDEQEENGSAVIRHEMEAGRLYSWEQWRFALKDGQLTVWSDDVAIDNISRKDNTLRIQLNESDKMKVALINSDGRMQKEEEKPGRQELNREMLHMVGIPLGTPSQSALNAYFVTSDGTEWTICPSVLGDKLVVKGIVEVVLFGRLFHSTLYVITNRGEKTVVCCMTDSAKLAMENELLELCSSPIRPGPEDLARIAALLRVGVDPNCTNTNGQTPLLLCLANQDEEILLKSLRILLEGNRFRGEGSILRKVDLNVKDRQQRNAFELLLNEERFSHHENDYIWESMKLLIDGGIYVNLKDSGGRTPLHIISKNSKENKINVDVMKLLIDNGIDVNWTDDDGLTPLHYLCTFNQNEAIVDPMELLIDSGVDVNAKGTRGQTRQTALHRLCENYGNENIVDALELLIGKGADVNLKDQCGRTALHHLCISYKEDNIVDAMMALLVKTSGIIKWYDNYGRTALDYLSEDPKMAGYKENFLEKAKKQKRMKSPYCCRIT